MEQGILMGTVPLFFSESKEIKLENLLTKFKY